MDFEKARFNMIEQQIRPWDVLDQRVLDLLESTPREDFVPDKYRDLAYADTCIPLANGQLMMEPRLIGRLLQALDIQPEDCIAEIGTGSGYLTALLARSGHQVFSFESDSEILEAAREKLDAAGIDNVRLSTGDGFDLIKRQAAYDVIVINGSLPLDDLDVQSRLADGGRLFKVIGEDPIMEAHLVTRRGENVFSCESLFECSLPALSGVTQPSRFEL